MNRLHLGVLCAAALSMGACGSERAPEPQTGGRSDVRGNAMAPLPGIALTPRGDTTSATMGSVHIDERIVKACGNLPTPHFAFDSAAIAGEAADMLSLVARCFVDGPLQGRGLKLVGRADPRGTVMYNLALGQDRATTVANFLSSKGLGGGQVTTMSKGELEATGTDEEGWARDRRVDILLAD